MRRDATSANRQAKERNGVLAGDRIQEFRIVCESLGDGCEDILGPTLEEWMVGSEKQPVFSDKIRGRVQRAPVIEDRISSQSAESASLGGTVRRFCASSSPRQLASNRAAR